MAGSQGMVYMYGQHGSVHDQRENMSAGGELPSSGFIYIPERF